MSAQWKGPEWTTDRDGFYRGSYIGSVWHRRIPVPESRRWNAVARGGESRNFETRNQAKRWVEAQAGVR